jgi:hypothetical protein
MLQKQYLVNLPELQLGKIGQRRTVKQNQLKFFLRPHSKWFEPNLIILIQIPISWKEDWQKKCKF